MLKNNKKKISKKLCIQDRPKRTSGIYLLFFSAQNKPNSMDFWKNFEKIFLTRLQEFGLRAKWSPVGHFFRKTQLVLVVGFCVTFPLIGTSTCVAFPLIRIPLIWSILIRMTLIWSSLIRMTLIWKTLIWLFHIKSLHIRISLIGIILIRLLP